MSFQTQAKTGVIGTIRTEEAGGLSYFTSTVSATVYSPSGRLFGLLSAPTSTIIITLLNYGATSALGTIIARLIAPANDTTGFIFSSKGVRFSTLVASLSAIDWYTVYYSTI